MTFWDWKFTFEILPLLASAALVTLEATLIGFVIAAVLGLAFAIGRMFGPTWLAIPLAGLIEFIRSTPLLIQIFFIYFVFPEFGVTIEAMTAGVLALGLHYATYCSEVYRAGLANVPRGQWEASIALNMTGSTPSVTSSSRRRSRPSSRRSATISWLCSRTPLCSRRSPSSS